MTELLTFFKSNADQIMFSTSLLFIISTFLQLLKIYKTKSASDISIYLCVGNAIGLFILAITMLSLELYLTCTITLLQCLLWFIILIYKKGEYHVE